MKKVLLLMFLFSVSIGSFAQIKIGNKKIDTKKVVNAASDVVNAITLTDEDIAAMSREYIQWMDTHNEIADPETEFAQRLEQLTANLKNEAGLDLNFKLYWVVDVNAFACGDGSIRVCAGLMEVMDDSEVMAVIGHEIGHIVSTDVKDAIKTAYLTSAARNAAGATQGVVQKMTDSQLGDLAEALAGAQYSQKQEYAADDYAFDFCIRHGVDPYAMSNALNKLVELSNAGGDKASSVQKMFSTHPDSEKRALRSKEKADEYVAANS